MNVLKHDANTVHDKAIYFDSVSTGKLAYCSVSYRTVSRYSILKFLRKCPGMDAWRFPSVTHTWYVNCKVTVNQYTSS